MLGLQQGGQDAKHGHEDDGEGLPGDGDVAPGLHRDGGGGQPRQEHRDELLVVRGHVALHVGAVERADGSHGLLVHPGADEGEHEAAHAEDEEPGEEGDDADGAEGGVEVDGEVEEGGEEEEVLQGEELQRHAEHMVELLQQVYQLLHLLPQRPDRDVVLLRAHALPVGRHRETHREIFKSSCCKFLVGGKGLGVGGLVDHVDAEDAVRVAQQAVNLFVDESEGVEYYGHHHHEEHLAEEADVDADHIGHEVDPEDGVQHRAGESVSDEGQLVDCGQNCSVAARGSLVSAQGVSSAGRVILARVLEEPVVVRLEDEERRGDVEHDLPRDEGLPGEPHHALVRLVRQQVPGVQILHLSFPFHFHYMDVHPFHTCKISCILGRFEQNLFYPSRRVE